MKTAEQMIEKRAFIKKEMDKNLPKEQSDALWAEATGRLEKILDKYSTIPKGVRLHTDRSIWKLPQSRKQFRSGQDHGVCDLAAIQT